MSQHLTDAVAAWQAHDAAIREHAAKAADELAEEARHVAMVAEARARSEQAGAIASASLDER